jgi:chitinase
VVECSNPNPGHRYGYISASFAQQLAGRASGGVAVKNDDGGMDNGQVQFNSLIAQGALQKKNGTYVGAGGFVRKWDSCSSTVRNFSTPSFDRANGMLPFSLIWPFVQPFLRSASQGQIITYDDPESLGLKGQFARKAGIKGVNMFDAHGDTASWELVDAVRKGLGLA